MKIVFETNPAFIKKHLWFLEEGLCGSVSSQTLSYLSDLRTKVRVCPNSLVIINRKNRFSPRSAAHLEVKGINSFFETVKSFFNSFSTIADRDIVGRSVASRWLLNALIIIGVLAAGVLWGPDLYYAIAPIKTVEEHSKSNSSLLASELTEPAQTQSEKSGVDSAQDKEHQQKQYLPPQQDSLPQGDWLVIPRIGVRSQLQATSDPHEALDTGIWLVPDFGKPGDLTQPMIVAGHRYGWKWWWKTDYWRYHSFYNLPELEPGDRIEVISNKRQWNYQVYAAEEGREITDYEANLILYTCKYLNSPIRYFRYARMIVPENALDAG